MKQYPVINIYGTGQKIKQIMQQQNITVRTIQEYLGLATPQSIYHWFSGRNMPSVDNLYALSELFGVSVDAMLCGNRKQKFCFEKYSFKKRVYAYYEKIKELRAG